MAIERVVQMIEVIIEHVMLLAQRRGIEPRWELTMGNAEQHGHVTTTVHIDGHQAAHACGKSVTDSHNDALRQLRKFIADRSKDEMAEPA